jgi:NO-binding membrane sensor protein with MHYT domain
LNVGQFAIDYFVLVYEPAYIIGAIIIACFAVTIALYIFFKLREKWMNQWYKRLGCACLMAFAVCGKIYFYAREKY